MNMNELSPSEVALIQQHRDKQALRDYQRTFARKAIVTAYAFSDWSEASGYELTFSTFIDSFGYQDRDSKLMYEAVKRIFETVQTFAGDLKQ